MKCLSMALITNVIVGLMYLKITNRKILLRAIANKTPRKHAHIVYERQQVAEYHAVKQCLNIEWF